MPDEKEPFSTYVVLCKSGRPYTFKSGMGGQAPYYNHSYIGLLENLASDAYAVNDPPNMLLRNGEVLIKENLAALALDYKADMAAAKAAAILAVAQHHNPTWAEPLKEPLKDDTDAGWEVYRRSNT